VTGPVSIDQDSRKSNDDSSEEKLRYDENDQSLLQTSKIKFQITYLSNAQEKSDNHGEGFMSSQ
jgi:hypothetical protein